MATKRYWDLAERERAGLTAEEVEKLLAYELMEKGVLAVEPLKIEEVAPVPLPARSVFLLREGDGNYGTLLPLVFATIEQAEAARDAVQFIREQDGWKGPWFTRPVNALQVVTEYMPTKDAVLAAKVPLDEQQRREAANSAARSEHEKACKAVADATSGIWDDWRECRRVEAKLQKIRDTFAEYLRMTDGSEDLARAFLAKVFDAEEIYAAVGGILPQATPPTAVSPSVVVEF